MKTLDFKSFNYVDADLLIGPDTVFFRGIDIQIPDDQVIRPGIPMFIGPEYIAKEYGHVYTVRPSRNIKLLDFRRLKNFMRLVITSRKQMSSTSSYDKFIECVKLITIAFGLCSYKYQVYLMEEHIKSIESRVASKIQLNFMKKQLQTMKKFDPSYMLHPLEPEGVRIAETQIDCKVMFMLKELFGDVYDGYIAPKMYSPFHVGNASHEEIMIFDPVKSGLVMYKNKNTHVPVPIVDISTEFTGYDIIELEDVNFKRIIMHKPTATGGGKSKKNKTILEDRNAMFDDPIQVKEAIKLAKFFSGKIRYKISDKGTLPRRMNLEEYNLLHKPDCFEGEC